MKRMFLLLALLLYLCVFSVAGADEAQDITQRCTITSPGIRTGNVHDGKYTSFIRTRAQKNSYLEFSASQETPAAYLYICFGEMPGAWEIQTQEDGQWNTLHTGSTDFDHVVVELGEKTHFRLVDTTGKSTRMKLNEVFVFGAGELPGWVQRWEPTWEKADLLLLVAHPDDELIFFGGTIPTYAGQLGKRVVVCYMTSSNTTRKSELLNGLWHLGVRNYPVIGEFYDTYTNNLSEAYSRWGKHDVRAYVTELIRRYKPDVALTHDVNGEYGHGAHRLCADAMQHAVANANDASMYSESAKQWGTWMVKKLYLHLSQEHPVEMNWNLPLSAFGGKTGLALAQEAYEMHVTQQNTGFVVTDEGETSCARFGLVHTTVGADSQEADFFEHIGDQALEDAAVSLTQEQQPSTLNAAILAQSTASAPLSDEAISGETTSDEATPGEATPSEAASKGTNTAETPASRKPEATVSWPLEAPPLDASGYPMEGETVYVNIDEGVWFYASPTLVVRIDRVTDEEAVLVWYEAHVYCDVEAERFGSILYDPEHPQKKHVQAKLIAKENQVVFGMNTDYYTYRLGRKTITGMVIRNAEVFFDRVPEANRSKFPNLDTLAMFSDGSWGVYHSDELTAEEYLDMGAVDVYSFGPYLVRDGALNSYVYTSSKGKTDQPRCAIGMIEPGHYFALLVEGRIRNESIGVTIPWMAEHMLAAGCTQALNLDGGQTAVMTFMGEQVSRIGKYNGGNTNPRTTTEIMGIGRSDLVQAQ